MTTITVRLRAVEPLNATVQQLLLDTTGFEFFAGQYIYLHAGQQRIPLSVASAPARLPELELHYRSTPGDADAAALDALLLHTHELTLDGPHGDVVITEPTSEPLTLIAGGTGISQAASIVEQLSNCEAQQQAVQLWWSLASPAAAYVVSAIERVSSESWVTLETLYDDPIANNNAAVSRIRNGPIEPNQYLLCGAPGFVYSCAQALLDQGINRSALRSDVFDYAPRPGWANNA